MWMAQNILVCHGSSFHVSGLGAFFFFFFFFFFFGALCADELRLLMGTGARLDAFARGQIWGMRKAGAERKTIRKETKKKDGTRPTLRSVDAVLAKKKADPKWRGEDSSAGGRPRALTTAQSKELVDLVFAERGQAKVTVRYCRKRLPFLREVSRKTVERELHSAGLAWLRRRRKTSVPKDWRKKRLTYCRWLKKLDSSECHRFAYTDGTTFYLARGPADVPEKRRAALGQFVWRMVPSAGRRGYHRTCLEPPWFNSASSPVRLGERLALANGKDGLWDDNIGPSLYAKSQGLPVKIWGFFCDGMLRYWVLPKDGRKTTNMNGERYVQLVQTRFAKWRRECLPRTGRVILVQDYERCLWQPDSVKALKAAGCDPLTRHTKYSPDLNAIETLCFLRGPPGSLRRKRRSPHDCHDLSC